MTEIIDMVDSTAVMEPAPGRALAAKIATEELAAELLARADGDGVSLVGPGGLLAGSDQAGARGGAWRRR